MPARPCVAEIMPAKILDASAFQGHVPRLGAHLRDCVALVREYVRSVLSLQTANNRQRLGI